MSQTWTVRAIIIIALMAMTLFWLTPLNSSLWLDETGTAWAAKGTLSEVVTRAYHPGQSSVLFSIVAWLALALGGLHEWTLRIPSLAACLVATASVYRLARRFCDLERSILAAGLFVTYGTVAFAAADARPYALALMCATAAMLALAKWCESGMLRWGISYVVLAALSVAFHYLCLTLLPLHATALLARHSGSRLPTRRLLGMCLLLASLLSLLAPHAMALWSARGQHSFAGRPKLREVVDAIVYYRLAAGLVLGLVTARWLYPDFSIRMRTLFTRRHAFLLGWYLCPILLLLGISLVSDAKLLVPRYYIWGVPGIAILAASALAAVEPLPARRLACLLVLLVFCARRIPAGPAGHGGQDWRGALTAAGGEMRRTGATLLLRSGFPENPVHTADDPLLAPLALYPVPGNVQIAPCWLKQHDAARLNELVSGLVRHRSTFLYVSPSDYLPPSIWLLDRLRGERYWSSTLGTFQGITAIKFEPR